MAKKKKTDQGEKAANNGDILKHPLICDVLQKCIDVNWKEITYAETHAGAGIYSSTVQPKETKSKAHIINLKSKHEKLNGKAKDHYWEILDTFWQVEGNHTNEETKYAGSAYLAARILKATNEKFDIRLTEYDPIACNHLKKALTGLLPTEIVGNHIEQASFQGKQQNKDMIDWLTANDNLVLIIDPFRLSIGSASINGGNIDLYHLLKLTESVKSRGKNAVVGFWYSTDRDSNQLGLSGFFDKTIMENYEEKNCRKYYFSIYNFVLIGFGKGKEIVNALPLQLELQSRWFNLKIKEKLFPKRMKGLLRSVKGKSVKERHKTTLQNIIEQIDNLEN